jgi:general secretion pathway protein D
MSHRSSFVIRIAIVSFAIAMSTTPVVAQRDSAIRVRGDSVTIRLVDVDVRAAVQALSQYLDRPVVFGAVNGGRVTLETPKPISRRNILPLLRSTLESQNLELLTDSSGVYRVRAKDAAPPPAPQVVQQPIAGTGQSRLFVIRLSHARAIDVAATINALYGRASAFGEMGARAPQTTLSQELAQNQAGTFNGMTQPPANQSGGFGTPLRSGSLSSETTIVPDQATNGLLVRGTQADFELISAAVKEIDVRPLQVLIEMLVAEVRHDRSLSFGVDATLPQHALPKNPDVKVSGSQTGLGLGDLVIRVMGAIMSRPAVVAANNEQAQILVGSQRPFVQVSRSLPTDAASRDQIVQYKDVGTKLSVRPTISNEGYVMLEVTQEISQATSEVQFNAPIISTRSVQTRLLLKDGQTIVIGGLRDRQREVTQSGVPILSSIPLLGGLFGRTTRGSNGTELFLFITPRVLRTDDDVTATTKPQAERAAEITK